MLNHFTRRFNLLTVIVLNMVTVAIADERDADGAHWQAPTIEAQRKNPVRANAVSIRRGARLFVGHCTACHGDRGGGDGPQARALKPPPTDLAEMVAMHSDGDLAWKIANGRGAMPAWKNQLKERDIWDTVNYLRYLVGNGTSAPAAQPRADDDIMSPH